MMGRVPRTPKGGPILWIDTSPVAQIDGDGVLVEYQSGDVNFRHRLSRSAFRRFIEISIRMLNAADLDEQHKITKMRKKSGSSVTAEAQLTVSDQAPN